MSFSAEHGVGSKRIHAVQQTGDPVKLATMAVVKRALDGAGMMNPGKVMQPIEAAQAKWKKTQ